MIFSKTKKSQEIASKQLLGDNSNRVIELREKFLEIIATIDQSEERHLRLLGMGLNAGWPQVVGYIENDNLSNCKIELFGIDPVFAREQSEWIDQDIILEAEHIIPSIEKYIESNKHILEKRNIVLTLCKYRTVPSVHGMILGTNDIFITNADWGLPQGPQQMVPPFYEHFSSFDSSKRAESYRALFNRWILAAEQSLTVNDNRPVSDLAGL